VNVFHLKSRQRVVAVFSMGHVLFWILAFFVIRHSHALLSTKLGVPEVHLTDLISRSVSLTFLPLFYPGAGLAGVAATSLVYGVIIASIVKFQSKGLFRGSVLLFVLYAVGLLVAASAGLRS
jgi:hypothetical protein